MWLLQCFSPTSQDPALNRLQHLLDRTHLRDLVHHQHVVTVSDTATVDQVLKTLASKHCLSAPVVSPAPEVLVGKECGHQQVLGFVDVRDILTSFLLELGDSDMVHMKMLQRMRLLEERGSTFGAVPLRKLRRFGGDGEFLHKRQLNASLREVIGFELLKPQERNALKTAAPIDKTAAAADGNGAVAAAAVAASGASVNSSVLSGGSASASRAIRKTTSIEVNPLPCRDATNFDHVHAVVHRLAICDDDATISAVVSQTDIVRFLYSHHNALGALAHRSAVELGFVGTERAVVSVSPETSAIEAMVLMNEKKISAVAVVDAKGKIIGNFSISELRTICAEHFGALSLPVGEFLALEHGTEYSGYAHLHEEGVKDTQGHKFVKDRSAREKRPKTPGEEVGQNLVLVAPEATFLEVMHRIVSHRIHRVYVVDIDSHPVGVVTCTDVLRTVLNAAGGALSKEEQDAEAKRQRSLGKLSRISFSQRAASQT